MSDFFIILKPSAVWTAENPSMPPNYLGVESLIVDGVETETNKAKLFNGIDAWNDLDYWSPSGASGSGDVVGPASATANGITVFNGITGQLVKDGIMTLPAASGIVGYLNIPQTSFSAAYPIVLTDSGKHLYHPATDANARQVTIPANASVAFPLGTAITIVNMSANNVTVIITTDTLNYVNVGAITTLTIPQYNEATILKTNTTEWVASGSAGCTTA